MKSQKLLLALKIIFSIILFYPVAGFAHLISITPTRPFPANVFFSSVTSASYTITNITSKTSLTIINKSMLPPPLAITSSTCGALIAPSKSCVINVALAAPATRMTASGAIKAWAKPSLDGVEFPININVIPQPAVTTVTLKTTFVSLNNTFTIINTQTGDGSNTLSANLPSGMFFVGPSNCTVSPTTRSCSLTVNAGSHVGNFTITPALISGTTRLVSSPNPLTITVTPILTAVGTYFNSSFVNLLMLALSTNNGISWSYPISGTSSLPLDYSNSNGFLSMSCGSSSSICIAGGQYTNTSSSEFPLLALSTNSGSSWAYPISSSLSSLPSDYSGQGVFNTTNCSGSGSAAICIAGGSYHDSIGDNPMLALSTNGGAAWSYPIDSLENLPPNFSSINGDTSFSGTSCNDTTCIAVGHYTDTTNKQYAMIALSTNRGSTWTYPISATGPLPNQYFSNGNFTTASCTNSQSPSICIAAGKYNTDSSGDNNTILLAASVNGGNWFYAIDSTPQTLPPNYVVSTTGTNFPFNSSSCSSGICIAVGQYFDGSNFFPLVAASHNGNTWAYPISSLGPLPSGYVDSGVFNSASCTGHGSSAICIAVGSYSSPLFTPMIAVSKDGGSSWIYRLDAATGPVPAGQIQGASISFNTASCNGSGSTATCIAGGRLYY